jgi:protein TonB
MKSNSKKSRTEFDIIAAGCLTIGIFLALPYANIIKNPTKPNLDLITIDQTVAPVPPPLPLPKHEVQEHQKEPLPKPVLAKSRRQVVPLQAMLDFDIGTTDIGGDFDVSFSVDPAINLGTESLFKISDVDRPPQPLVQLKPLYPANARMRRIEGRVRVEFTVTADGHTESIAIISADPAKTFNRAAIRAIERWRFSPAALKGNPVAVRVSQTIRFEID